MQIFDLDHADSVAEVILEILEDTGYDNPTEAIPGLVKVILTLAQHHQDPDLVLDGAARLLADGDLT